MPTGGSSSAAAATPEAEKRSVGTEEMRAAWEAFMAADEVTSTLCAHAGLLAASGVAPGASGDAAFFGVNSATSAEGAHKSQALMGALTDQRQLRASAAAAAKKGAAAKTGKPLRVVVSGAGPVGLRCAAELALLGNSVLVLEKRTAFSRVNILTLWSGTAQDLAAFGAKVRRFYRFCLRLRCRRCCRRRRRRRRVH